MSVTFVFLKQGALVGADEKVHANDNPNYKKHNKKVSLKYNYIKYK